MTALVATFQGRFGNCCMQYLFCRAAAQNLGMELQMDPWEGERVFDIHHRRPDQRARDRWNEIALSQLINSTQRTPSNDIDFRGYAQLSGCMIYTKSEAQVWLRVRHEFTPVRARIAAHYANPVVAHRRVGDYVGYGYPIVSEQSYLDACLQFGLGRPDFITEESPTSCGELPDGLPFLADFFRLMDAKTILRGNSTFSWVAALLGDGLVLSPIIDGLEGGREHHCRFVAGNHPRLANLDFTQDLYVAP